MCLSRDCLQAVVKLLVIVCNKQGTMNNYLYGGVNFSLVGNGGEECKSYLSTPRIYAETALYTTLAIVWIVYGYVYCRLPASSDHQQANIVGQQWLQAIFCLIFGVEIGYKICTQQLLFLLHPCHIISFLQVG